MQKVRLIKQLPYLAVPEHNLADVMALKAVYAGTATPEQQQRAMLWLLKKGCMIGGISETPGDEAATHHKEGRRFVGVCINDLINEPVDEIRKRLKPPTEEN